MITPLDVQKKDFSKGIRGYSEREVNEYLIQIADTLETHINEKADLKERIMRIEEDVNKYRAIESTLSETLVLAKKTSDDLISTAKREAESIVKDAEITAKAKVEAANRQIAEMNEQRMHMEKDLEAFRLRIESMLRAQLSVVENYAVDLK
ncbi:MULTISPECIES: DivIVA domain-containing protein [unclassified Fusibacter]|uniref:DivIVA domain-containing protein n=1 Tax=unclassified Fusibacter TaxID=2624464 RepID=UPI001010A829|nr:MULTISPECIES: DivIVA domain-containing protein [unclassified Fusibacter]MCK8058030.1 DivIVA domain-containing protein [Fusibacter sp. A2]NPE20612.1 DivIVA domain-containing protein [Fusibacter sp. A1]RXV62819.1 DivIVA domain-containing protein [Fusibacter sp. A1]